MSANSRAKAYLGSMDQFWADNSALFLIALIGSFVAVHFIGAAQRRRDFAELERRQQAMKTLESMSQYVATTPRKPKDE